jgi:hypothetical protein
MPKLERLPGSDEPRATLEDLIRCHGAGSVLCTLASVLGEHRKVLRAEGAEPVSCQTVRGIARKCERAGDTLTKEGL